MSTVIAQIQMRRDTASNWTSNNPTLESGEWGYESDTKNLKLGDGSTAWADLPYYGLSPAGAMSIYAGSSAPDGWLLCDGSAVNRETYSTLFAVIGTTYGSGDGSTTFNVPDMRGMFPRGTGTHGSATDAGGTPFSGPALGSIENDQMQGHRHDIFDPDSNYRGQGGMFLGPAQATAENYVDTGTNSATVNNMTGDPGPDGTNGAPRTGGETRPVSMGLNYIIKT